MSQSATLYRIAFADLLSGSWPNGTNLRSVQKGYQTFSGTHEGLRFVLWKLEGRARGIADQIFYPVNTIGEGPDWSTLTPEELEEVDIDAEPLYYHTPQKVAEIADILQPISVEMFQAHFDPDDLNANGIYPVGAWNREADERYAFNLRGITVDFLLLTSIFAAAKRAKDCLLSFVG